MLLNTLLSLALFGLSLAHSTRHPHDAVVKKRAAAFPLGLSANNLKSGQVSLGFLPGFGEPLGPNDITSLNKKLPKPMALVGTYTRISTGDLSMSNIDSHVTELLKQKGDKPVLVIALGVDSGLKSVDRNMAIAIAQKMASIEQKGITVWLRPFWEMNGDWYAWGGQPADFIAAWKLVYTMVHRACKKTHMLWSPNSLFADGGNVNAVRGGWAPYFPGKNWVDLTGLSFYHYGGFERRNILPAKNAAVDQIKKFDSLYGSKIGKYVVLSETSASYARDVASNTHAPGGASEYNIKTQWFNQVIAAATQKAVPYFRAAVFFEIVKDENAGGNSPVKRMNFQILANTKIRTAILAAIKG